MPLHSDQTTTQPARKSKKRIAKKNTEITNKKAATRVVKTIKNTTVTKAKQSQPTQQGGWKVPKASDTHGCQHTGLRDLVVLDKDYLTSFVKRDGWLYNKPCIDCAEMENDDTNNGKRILNMATLLEKGNRVIGYYCNCGPTGHKMKHDDPTKQDYACDLVLCQECFNTRESKRSASTSGRRTRGATSV